MVVRRASSKKIDASEAKSKPPLPRKRSRSRDEDDEEFVPSGYSARGQTTASAKQRQHHDTSAFRGVTFHIRTGRYEAHIWHKKKQLYLGGYDSPALAGVAYDIATIHFKGSDAETNFHINHYPVAQLQQYATEELLSGLRRHSKGTAQQSSSFRGVTRHAKGRWEARIGNSAGRRYTYLGLHTTEFEAAQSYDRAAIEQKGIHAFTNFHLCEYLDELSPEQIQQALKEGILTEADINPSPSITTESTMAADPSSAGLAAAADIIMMQQLNIQQPHDEQQQVPRAMAELQFLPEIDEDEDDDDEEGIGEVVVEKKTTAGNNAEDELPASDGLVAVLFETICGKDTDEPSPQTVLELANLESPKRLPEQKTHGIDVGSAIKSAARLQGGDAVVECSVLPSAGKAGKELKILGQLSFDKSGDFLNVENLDADFVSNMLGDDTFWQQALPDDVMHNNNNVH
jgi:hypothetical protein